MRSTVTLILTILATLCQGSVECPIECYCERMLTSCTGDKLLTRFPQQHLYPPTTTRLELRDYGVQHLSGNDFLQIIGNLSELSMTRNALESLSNDTFFGDGLKVKILDLSQNKLQYFVGGGRLRGLKLLDLSSNLLQQVYELGAIESLESVNLRDNRIGYLKPATFQNLRYLQYINLDSNQLGSLDPSTFSNLQALGHLILSSNPNLVPRFYWNSRVQFVDVSKCGLTSIPSSLTKTVRDFRCANNNLTIIRQTDFESYPNVGLLVLDENYIEVVEEDAFGRLDYLTRLWMNGNRLNRVPQNLPPTLQSLHLEDNLILNLSSSDFRNLRNLGELNLHSNRITSLPPFVFAELTSLKFLDLRSNSIDIIYKESFSNLSKLESLDMSQNPIKVVQTGAFGDLGKLSLLHLSRLMDPIEFDTTSFSPLQKLQILELDDSPHLVLKLITDQAFTHLGNSLRELNLQRCELEDLKSVCSSLAELNLQVVKLSGNPWDCEDLYGLQELMNKGSVVDWPLCQQPPHLKGVLLSSLNFSTAATPSPLEEEGEEGEEEEENLLDFTELTQDQHGQEDSALDKVTNAPNTNSPENVAHALDANVNPFTSTLLPPLSLPGSGSTSSRPKNATAATNVNATVVPISPVQVDPSDSSYKVPTTNNPPKDKMGSESDLVDSVPTRSYFDANSISSFNHERGESTSGGDKNPTILIPIRRTASLDKTKTNDDNTIIDARLGAERRRRPPQRPDDGEETGPKSIDGFHGFPSGYSDVDGEPSPTSNSKKAPKAFYLRRESVTGSEEVEATTTTSGGGAIIIKTLIITATACLVSILLLLSLGYAVYKVSFPRSRLVTSTSITREDSPSRDHYSRNCAPRMSYTRFGRDRSSNQNLQDFDSDSDQAVELSGITNRLYMENEEIFHIT